MRKSTRCLTMLFAALLLAASATACGGKNPPATSSGVDSSMSVESMSAGESSSPEATNTTTTSETETQAPEASGGKTKATTASKTASQAVGNQTVPDKLPDYKITNKTLKLFVGDERTLKDYRSKTDAPGAVELCEKQYGMKFELVLCNYNEWYTKLNTLKLSNQMPDVMWPDAAGFPKDIVNDLLLPLDDYFNFNDALWADTRELTNQHKWNGKTYMAVIADGLLVQPVFYNPKLFKANGLPTPNELMEKNQWTWDKMRELAVELTQDTNGDGKTDQWGIGGLLFTALPASTGKSMLTVEGKTVTHHLDDPVFANAATFLYDLGPNGKYKCAMEFNHGNSALFASGKIAMDVGSHWRAWDTYKDMWAKGTVDVALFPKAPGVDKYYMEGIPQRMAIFKGSKNIEAAKAFIYAQKYVTTSAYKTKYAKEIGDPNAFLYKSIPGLTATQYKNITRIWENPGTYGKNMNTWIGWFGNGWDNGLQKGHEKQWSSVLAALKPKVNANIKNLTTRLESVK